MANKIGDDESLEDDDIWAWCPERGDGNLFWPLRIHVPHHMRKHCEMVMLCNFGDDAWTMGRSNVLPCGAGCSASIF